MNEGVKKYRPWLIAIAALLVWAVSASGAGFYFSGRYRSLQSIIDAAGGSGLAELAEQQRDTIISLQDDLSAIRGELESAAEYARELRDRNRRAIIIAQRSDDRLAEFENTVDDAASLIERIERRQQRIDELVIGIREDNRAIRMELGMRP